MPWGASDASSKTKKAKTPAERKAWAKIANRARKEYGDDATAIKVANAAIKHMKQK